MGYGAEPGPEDVAETAEERPPGEPLADAGINAPKDPGWMSLTDVRVGAAVSFNRAVGRSSRDDLPDAGVAAEMTARVRLEPLEEPLTRREIEVLGLMAGGGTNRAIAEKLTISPGTVRVHVQHILEKLGVSDRTGAVVRGMGLGLVSPETREHKDEYSG